MRVMVFGSMLSLVGCDNKAPEDTTTNTADTVPTVVDDDGDGFAVEEDCDDTDAAIHPDAAEVCDGIDNDCDSLTDDEDDSLDTAGASTWYTDSDADGHGSPEGATLACAQPSGAVLEALDCDDTDATIHPDAAEVCDGIDNDCDSLTDDEDDSIDATTQTAWFPDADGDGYGDAADSGLLSCDPPLTAHTPDNTDCDDTTAAISPSVGEVCDGIDNDCDTNPDNNAGAVFTSDAGILTDLGSLFRSGTASASSLWVSSESGTLNICEGTWYTRLKLNHSIAVIGADAASTILDASLNGSVISATAAGTTIAVEGVTLTNGSGETGAYSIEGGGGINCGGSVILSLTDIISTANYTDIGGGLLIYDGCEATVSGSEFSNSYGLFGMGVGVLEGSAIFNDSVISGNQSTGYGAGILVGQLGGVYMELNDTLVENNTTSSNGGGMAVEGSPGRVEIYCTGSSKTTSGFLNNTSTYDGGGVILLDSAATFEAVDCDFNKSNSPDDVFSSEGDSYDFGTDASFTCIGDCD